METGKYTKLNDAYISVIESLRHACALNDSELEIKWILSEEMESIIDSEDNKLQEIFADINGVLVPGGFGERGIEGKIKAIAYARENKIPFLGLCLGMQCAVIEFARNVANLQSANSTEFETNTPHPVIDFMEGQSKNIQKGGTMRLGAYPCQLLIGSLVESLYNASSISERHRHRYEFNNLYRNLLTEAGLIVAGINTEQDLVEIIELSTDIHPFFVGTQFHPEYKSRPSKGHPLFVAFIKASLNNLIKKSKFT